jgi:aminoglycoside/choline kinase family phosphotransferase
MGNRKRKAMGDNLLEELLQQEKKLTAKWYARMSGEVPWMQGEKQGYDAVFASLSAKIKARQAELTAD